MAIQIAGMCKLRSSITGVWSFLPLAIVCFMAACGAEASADSDHMRTLLKCTQAGKQYVLCDPIGMPSENCYLDHSGKRYLKKEKIFFGASGSIDSIVVFKPEGVIVYNSAALAGDSLLVKENDWGILDKVVIKDDSIVFPFKSAITEIDKTSRKIFSLRKSDQHTWLYLMEY